MSKKISELTENTALADGDLFAVVDVSDTPDSTEKATLATVRTGVLLGSSGLTNIGGDGQAGVVASASGIFPKVDGVHASGYTGLRWENVYSMQYQATNWIEKPADASAITDTTLVTDAHLTVNLTASSKYKFRACLFTTSGGVAEGFKVAVTGSAGVTSMKVQVTIYDDTLNAIAGFGRVTAINTAVGAALSAGDNYATVEGTIETSTAGTFALSWAQNAAGASAGVAVQRNSDLIVHRCA